MQLPAFDWLYLMPANEQGNKSFIAFSNLGDTDSLTKTWKVCLSSSSSTSCNILTSST